MSENDTSKKGALPGDVDSRESLPEDLVTAAADWQPDSAGESPSAQAAAEGLNPEGGNDYVTFVDDPYGIRTIEIAEAQQISDELDLDHGDGFEGEEEEIAPVPGASASAAEGADETAAIDADLPELQLSQDESHLENLARAIADQVTQIEEQVRASEAATEEERAQELAAQIAEDQALNEQMAREAAEAEKALETDPELLAALPKEPQPDADGNLDLSELQSCIETLLFMMDKPVSAKRLQELLGPHFKEGLFAQALEGLQARYASPGHGIELVPVANGWQLRTKPGRAALAKKLARVQTQRLSGGGMETLAIVAYRQPVLKEEIDKIRGVDSSYFIRGLMDRKLIGISGRSELPGRPMLYSTTDQFLELFGLKDLSSLPSLRELEQMVPQSQSKNPEDEDPRVKEMRRLVGQMKSDTSTTLKYDPREDEKILKEIRERVGAIPTTTPYLEEQKALEKAAKEEAARAASPENLPEGTQLSLESAQPPAAAPEDQRPELLDIPPSELLDEPAPSSDHL